MWNCCSKMYAIKPKLCQHHIEDEQHEVKKLNLLYNWKNKKSHLKNLMEEFLVSGA